MRRTAFPFLLFALALVARLGVAGARGIDRPPAEDGRGYFEIAGNLAAGRGFVLDRTFPRGDGDVHLSLRSPRPPLWPAALAGVRLLGGGPAAGRVLAAACGALSVLALWLFARRLLPRGPAAAVALAFAVWPAHLFACSDLYSEPLFMLLTLLALLALQGGGGLPAGALLGLAVLARPAGLALLAPLALFVLLAPVFAGRRGRALAALLVAAVAVPLPWLARNAVIHGRPLLTTNGGVTFFGGNNARSLDGPYPGGWLRPQDVLREAPPEYGQFGFAGLTEEESDREFFARGLSFVRDEPGRWGRLLLFKALRFFDPDQHSRKPDRGLKRLAGWLSFGPVLLLAVAGALLTLRARWRDLLLVHGLVAAQLATALAFYGDARMRLPAEPAFLILAGVASGWIVSRRGGRGVGRARPSA
ncbi:MAG: glycosyltransferase family 39 protein [Planctomycetes bacterium]|jgi:hypothetical protein|nr:glycosyltransferase family 39 protein [Planctomycetota bacterium]